MHWTRTSLSTSCRKDDYSSQKGYNATDNVDCFVKYTVNVTSEELLYELSAGLDIIGVVGAALSTVNVTVLEVAVLPDVSVAANVESICTHCPSGESIASFQQWSRKSCTILVFIPKLLNIAPKSMDHSLRLPVLYQLR